MTTLSQAGSQARATDTAGRPRRAIPTSAFTHRRGRVAGDGLTLRVVHPFIETGEVRGVVDEVGPSDELVQLVLTSYGPIATHSVWHDHGLGSGDIRELAAEARDNVRLADELLEEIDLARPVMPVVVVWGPDETAVPSGGRVRHDVMFVRGGELAALLRTYLGRSDAFTADDARELTARLDARRGAGHDRLRPATPRGA